MLLLYFFPVPYCTLVTYVNWRLLILSHLNLANLQLLLFGNTRNNEGFYYFQHVIKNLALYAKPVKNRFEVVLLKCVTIKTEERGWNVNPYVTHLR